MRSRSRGKGKVWEDVCNNSRDGMQQRGILSWLRMHPPIQVIDNNIGKPGQFLACYRGKGPPDWIALHNGISILGDDKDCKKLPWGSWNIKKHQASSFDQHQKNGGIACILLRMPDRSRWVLSWSRLKPLWDNRVSLEVLNNTLVDSKTKEDVGAKLWMEKEATVKGEVMMVPFDWLTPLLEISEEKEK